MTTSRSNRDLRIGSFPTRTGARSPPQYAADSRGTTRNWVPLSPLSLQSTLCLDARSGSFFCLNVDAGLFHMLTVVESGKPAFFCHSFSRALLRANFLRPAGSRLLLSRFRPPTIGFPPIKQPLALEAEATRFWCPKKMGQEKGENSSKSYYMLSGIASGVVCSPAV